MIIEYSKDTFTLPIEVTDPAGVPINFTGVTIQFTLALQGGVPITEGTTGVTITKDSIGNIVIEMTASLMRTIVPGFYPYEVRVIYADGKEDTLFEDTLQLLAGVPR